jgi:hypothetical protein
MRAKSFGLISTFIFVIIALSSFGFATNLNDSLIAYYKLDEISGTTASDSIGNYNGIATNSAIFTSQVSGIINTGADMNNSHYITIHEGSDFNLQDFSISAWVKYIDIQASILYNLYGNSLYRYGFGFSAGYLEKQAGRIT